MIYVRYLLTYTKYMSNTLQTIAVKKALVTLGHATNQKVHERVRETYPHLSATTVHRITSRLAASKDIGYAPSNGKTVMLDAKPEPHDHFVCKACGGMKDISLPSAVFVEIQQQLGKNIVENQLVIYGICVDCAGRASQFDVEV